MASEGLQSAIQAGNVEALHLLIWSGLFEKIDVKLLCWALRNAGDGGLGLQGRLRTINCLLRLGYTVMSERERGKVEMELAEMRDDGIMGGDEERVDFVKAVVNSETLKGKINIRI